MLRIIVKKIFDLLGFVVAWKQPWMNNYTWLRELNINTVLDIGANEGQYAKQIRSILPEAMIYSFEPIPAVYQKLIANGELKYKFKAFNVGLGTKKEFIQMNLNEFSPSSSLLDMTDLHRNNVPLAQKTDKITIEIHPLDMYMNQIDINDSLLIKIDVQGFEDKVIDGGVEIIKKAKAITVEVSFQELYQSQPLFKDVYDRLIRLGFEYMGNLDNYFDQKTGAPLYSDALFIKK
jgi:FkbM family methyltransferase